MSLYTGRSFYRQSAGKLSTAYKDILYVAEGVSGAVLLGFIFYNSIIGAVPPAVFVPFYIHIRRKNNTKKEKQRILEEFKEGMNAVAVALRAGYSVENAFIEAGRVLGTMSGTGSEKTDFFGYIRSQLSVNINIEDALATLAHKLDVPDIVSFAEVFAYAKRSGGNMVEIIQDTVNTISDKADTAREISVLISAKQLEQVIMDVVPIGIILYLRFTAWELISRMYGNLYGAAVMTICLAVYMLAVFISLKIADIRV